MKRGGGTPNSDALRLAALLSWAWTSGSAGIWMPADGWAYGSIPDWGGNMFFS